MCTQEAKEEGCAVTEGFDQQDRGYMSFMSTPMQMRLIVIALIR